MVDVASWKEKARTVLERTGLSVQEAERRLGWPRNTLSRYLNSRQAITVDRGLKLARLLEVSMEWLFDPETDWPPPEAPAVPKSAIRSELLRIFELAEGIGEPTPPGTRSPGKASRRRR